jgi:U4/U6.U5 tri-snRNP-associated protein 2
VYCLPEGYEVVERSLDDIRYVLDPSFAPAEVARLDAAVSWARALDGSEYMPGLVGLNNMKANDYANVAVEVTGENSKSCTLYPGALNPRPGGPQQHESQ